LSENFVNGKPVKFICTLLLERCENKQSRTYFQRPNVVVISRVAGGGVTKYINAIVELLGMAFSESLCSLCLLCYRVAPVHFLLAFLKARINPFTPFQLVY
jgi:hypothetical protein